VADARPRVWHRKCGLVSLSTWLLGLRAGPLGLAGMRLTAVGVAVFVLFSTGAVLCQRSLTILSSSSLPDAPSAARNIAPSRATSLLSSHQASPVSGLSFRLAALREAPSLKSLYSVSAASVGVYSEPPDNDSFAKEMARLFRHNVVFHPATSGSLMRRATEAASSVAIVRAPDGKGKLNTSYFLGVLSSAVLRTAYRPYWNRPVSAPFSDFGSTIGNDAGMNLLHQFGPRFQELMKSHTPKLVSKIEARIAHR
jgi:hypothetical protein